MEPFPRDLHLLVEPYMRWNASQRHPLGSTIFTIWNRAVITGLTARTHPERIQFQRKAIAQALYLWRKLHSTGE